MTCALPLHWVTALRVRAVAQALLVAAHAVRPLWTHPLPAVGAHEPGFTQTAPVDVVAARSIGAVAHTLAVLAIAAHCTLLTASGPCEACCTLAVSCLWVTLTTIVTHTLPRAVQPKAAHCTVLCTHSSRPSRSTGTHALSLTTASVLTGASVGTASPGTGLVTECSSEPFSASTLPSLWVTRATGSTQALLQTALAEGFRRTGVLAAGAGISSATLTGAREGVAVAPVLTRTQLPAVRAPVHLIAGAGAVFPVPTALTLAPVRGLASPVDTLLRTSGDTFIAALIIARTALVPPAVGHLYSLSICRLVGDPVTGAPIETPSIRTGLLRWPVVRAGI